jgi:hypothetical protein
MSIEISLFKDSFRERISITGNRGELIEVMLGDKYSKIGIQIKTPEKKFVSCLPDSGDDKKSIRYIVHFSFQNGKDLGKTNDLYKYDETTDNDEIVLSAKVRELKTYFFPIYNVCFDTVGLQTFVVRVSSPAGGGEILREEINFMVKALPAVSCDVKEKSLRNQLGKALPEFTILFFDALGNKVPYEGKLEVKLESPVMKVVPRDGTTTYTRLVKASQGGTLVCKHGDWIAVPISSQPLLSANEVIVETEVPFIATIISIDTNKTIGTPIPFSILFTAGVPSKLLVLRPETQPILLKAGERLSLLHVVVMDFWNNRVAPVSGQKWELALSDGPLASKITSMISSSGEGLLVDLDVDEHESTGIVRQRLELLMSGQSKDTTRPFVDLECNVVATNVPSKLKVNLCCLSMQLSRFLCEFFIGLLPVCCRFNTTIRLFRRQ